MTLLTDASIDDILVRDEKDLGSNPEKLLIENFNEKSLTPVGYDLRVGSKVIKVDLKRANVKPLLKLEKDQEFEILPNEMVVIRAEEIIGMPKSRTVSGIIVSKVSLVNRGLSHISTSIDADWFGPLVMTIFNHSYRTIHLKRGEPFCTMILIKNENPSKKASGKSSGGHIEKVYQEWLRAQEEYKKVRKEKWLKILRIPGVVPVPLILWFFYTYPKWELLVGAVAYSAMYIYYVRELLHSSKK